MANLLSSTIGGHFYGSNNQSNILLKTAGNAGDGGILLQNSAGAFKFQIYGNATDYGFLDGAWADWDIRKTINGKLYLNGTTSYYLQTDAHSYLSTLDVGDASNGVSLNVGNGSAHGVYTLDNARNYLVVAADYYPHMALVASGSNNTTHGAVFSFVGTEGSSARQWNIGIPNQNPFIFSIGYNRTGDPNPHYGVGDEWSSEDYNHARLSIDRDGNTKIRGMLYVNGTSGGISVGNAVIHAGNIGSQSVDYASSAGNADTVDSLHASSFVRNDTTNQYLKPYYEYGSYLTTERPIDLRNQMDGGGMRVDFMHPSYAGGGSWNHVITFSAYDAYNMYQLGGYYDGGSVTNLYVRSEANHGRTSWTAWRRLLNEVADPYAVNMNQYVRTTDGPTFAEVYSNGWFRNNEVNEGVYNQATGTHFYSHSTQGWTVTGAGGTIELQFRSNHQSTLRGYVYADTSNNIGFLNNVGSWSLRCDSSGNVTATGDVTAYSDARLKTDVNTIEGALEKVLQMRGVTYVRTDNNDTKEKVGVIAQEIQQVLPQVVQENTDGYLTVSYGNIVGVLIEAIKEQQAQIDELKAKLDGLTK